MEQTERPFADLTPEAVLAAAEQMGLGPDGRLFALNSYENRVYRLGREEGPPVVLKFYRAGRWSDAQILEEHEFTTALAGLDIAVAAPLVLDGRTLHHVQAQRVTAFPLCPGVAPELDLPGARELLGRTLGRMHAAGALRPFRHRPALRGERLGAAARETLLASGFLPDHMLGRYEQCSAELLQLIDTAFAQCAPVSAVRLHGDCHLGNILWQPQGPLFVDLDDCMMGPRIQDLWMFLAGSRDEQRRQWLQLWEGYQQFATLEWQELRLIEALRAVRMLNHAAWVAQRWSDPAFPRAFPWMGEVRFWEQYVLDLAAQCEAVEGPSLFD